MSAPYPPPPPQQGLPSAPYGAPYSAPYGAPLGPLAPKSRGPWWWLIPLLVVLAAGGVVLVLVVAGALFSLAGTSSDTTGSVTVTPSAVAAPDIAAQGRLDGDWQQVAGTGARVRVDDAAVTFVMQADRDEPLDTVAVIALAVEAQRITGEHLAGYDGTLVLEFRDPSDGTVLGRQRFGATEDINPYDG